MINRLVVIGLILLSFSGKAQNFLSYEEAVAIGLENNFDILISLKSRDIATSNYSRGNAGFLPTVDLEARKDFQRTNVDAEILRDSSGTFNIRQDWAKSDQFNGSAGLEWTIFDGMGMFTTYERLGILEEIGELDARITIENSIASISDIYYLIVAEEAKMNVLEQTLEISNNRVELARSRYEVGKGSKLDYLSAQVDLNADKTAYLVQGEVVHNARVDLNQLLARDVEDTFAVEDEIKLSEMEDYISLKQKILASSPQLLRAMSSQNDAYLRYKEVNAERYPSLDFNLSYNYSAQNNEASQLRSSTNDGLNYGLSASWNVFDGFNRNRRAQNARIEREIAALDVEAVKLELTAILKKVYHNYQVSLNLIELEKTNLEIAKENESIAIDRYELGAGTFLELREAQSNAVDANIRLLDVQSIAKRSEIEMLRISGGLIGVAK